MFRHGNSHTEMEVKLVRVDISCGNVVSVLDLSYKNYLNHFRNTEIFDKLVRNEIQGGNNDSLFQPIYCTIINFKQKSTYRE